MSLTNEIAVDHGNTTGNDEDDVNSVASADDEDVEVEEVINDDMKLVVEDD